MKVYRVEDPILKHGLWRNFDGTVNPVFSKLTVGKCKDMPMEDSDFYRSDGEQWFAATDTPDKLKAWFDVLDIIEMERLGYAVYEFDVDSVKTVSPFEVVFIRDSIRSVKVIDPCGIWENYNSKRGANAPRRMTPKAEKYLIVDDCLDIPEGHVNAEFAKLSHDRSRKWKTLHISVKMKVNQKEGDPI